MILSLDSPAGRHTSRSVRQAARGFTLVELLVAMTLLGLLMAAIFGSLRLGSRVWERTEAQAGDRALVEAVHDFLKRRIEDALPLAVATEGENDAPVFEGAAHSLRFAAILPGHLGAGLHVIELRQETVDQAAALVLRWQGLEPRRGVINGTSRYERALIGGILALDLAYFGKTAADSSPTWHQSWQGEAALPMLIRLALRFPDGDPRQWAALLVRPMVDLAEVF